MNRPVSQYEALAVLRAVRDDPEAPRSGYWQAAWVRDLLLVAWAAHHPGRLPELWRVTWRADNSGSLQPAAEGGWLYVPTSASPSNGRKGEYRLASLLADLTSLYVTEARPRLLRRPSDSLLLMESNHLQRRLCTLFGRHLDREVSMSNIMRVDLTHALT
jgi:hypothetical protein